MALDGQQKRQFQQRLSQWYRRYGRDLPWRRTTDPYAILVSEVMLQQTQVERVLEFYRRFLARFPTVAALAAASVDDVLTAWQGLGYYRRARNLHLAAQQIMEHHQGVFPDTFEEVAALPGVGRYTAGAVLCFAFGKRAPILDTNVQRVLERIFVRRPAAQPECHAEAPVASCRGGITAGRRGLGDQSGHDGSRGDALYRPQSPLYAVLSASDLPRCPYLYHATGTVSLP